MRVRSCLTKVIYSYIPCQAEQRLSEWQSTFGITALMIVRVFFDMNKKDFPTDEERQQFAMDSIGDYAFLYANVKVDDAGNVVRCCDNSLFVFPWIMCVFLQVKRLGIFRGPFVLQTFAAHLNSVCGAHSHVPTLGLPGNPMIALAFSAAAVRIFTQVYKNTKTKY